MREKNRRDGEATEAKEPSCPYCGASLEYIPDQDDSVALVCKECSYTARIPSPDEVRRVCRRAGRAVPKRAVSTERQTVVVFIENGTVTSVAGSGEVRAVVCDFDMGDAVGGPTVEGRPCDIRVWDHPERLDKTVQEVLDRIKAGEATTVL